jgi:UDP-N-acetylmuramoyl-L-alanyl-D-glutamate--2,6-diaminopimelate ligase
VRFPRLTIPTPPAWAERIATVGVTGTNGKSTTTTWLAAALRRLGGPVVRITTLGFYLDDEQLALPKDYDGFVEAMRLGLERGARHAAIELTSEALGRGFARAWPCRVGVFTNLTHDHLDAHGTPEHYLASKAQLFVSLPPGGTAVLNGCDPTSELLAEVLPSGVRLRTYGVASRGDPVLPLDASATETTATWAGTRLTGTLDGAPLDLLTPGLGDIYAENALAALVGAEAMGVPREAALEALATASPPAGRFEVVSERPYVVIDYAHSPDALARTLAVARGLLDADGRGGALWVVFGAGGARDREKRGPMGAAARAADHVVITNDNPRGERPEAIAAMLLEGLGAHPSARTELDRRLAIRHAVRSAAPSDAVLLCGMGHEGTQTIGGVSQAFSDREVALAALAAR